MLQDLATKSKEVAEQHLQETIADDAAAEHEQDIALVWQSNIQPPSTFLLPPLPPSPPPSPSTHTNSCPLCNDAYASIFHVPLPACAVESRFLQLPWSSKNPCPLSAQAMSTSLQ